MLKYLSPGNWSTIAIVAFVCSGLLSNVYAEQGSDSMRFAPQDYSPYQAERSWIPQAREQVTVPYNQPQPPPVSAAPAPQTKRPYEMLSPSGRGYYPYGGGPGYGGGYPGRGYGGGPGYGGGYPGRGSWGSMPWGGSPWPGASPFGMFGGPGGGGFPFGW